MLHIIGLVGNIRQMYIDSPVFPKRKVLVNPANTEARQPYQFGTERDKLKHHVYQQLNQHEDDHSILQKFRKEAEQLRKQKYEAKRNRSPHIDITPTTLPSKQFQPHPSREMHLNPQFVPTTSRILDEPSERTNLQQRKHHRAGEQSERSLVHHYQKLLKVKEKELKKKAKKLQKCRMVIGKMNSKIDHLRQEKKLVAKEQELQMMKINALIDEMNFKIAENKIAFREEIARLKVDLVGPPPPRAPARINQSIPVLPRSHKIYNHADSERLLQGPSLYYQIPPKQTIDLIQKEIDTNIASASAGLRRMKESHLVLQNEFEKYKEL